jgi:hypothetical protein
MTNNGVFAINEPFKVNRAIREPRIAMENNIEETIRAQFFPLNKKYRRTAVNRKRIIC